MILTPSQHLIILIIFLLSANLFVILAARRKGKKWLKKNFPELDILNNSPNLNPSTRKILRIQLLKRENNWYAGRINFDKNIDLETEKSFKWLIDRNTKLINKMNKELMKGDYS